MFTSIYVREMNCITPLGASMEENWTAVLQGKSAIIKQDIGTIKNVCVSKILGELTQEDGLTHFENLAFQVAQPILGLRAFDTRIGFILSTTKGNIKSLQDHKIEEAELARTAEKISTKLGFTTTPIVISHACVSGLLSVIVAKRLIQMGQYDEVLVIAVDELSEFVISGFQSFQAMSDEPCKPFDSQRKGVTLGEAAVAVWITKDRTNSTVEIIGEGAINDANHISGPSRTGEGLYRSVLSSLKEANVSIDKVDFISAHGTATIYNDEMEAIAFDRLGLSSVPLHSLKGYFGHTLGASGLLELVFTASSLINNTLIPSLGYQENGTSKDINVISKVEHRPISMALKTASGFGGSNAALLLKKI